MKNSELLDKFLDGIDEKIEKIRQYKESHDMVNYAKAMGYIEAFAENLGFTELNNLAASHKKASENNDPVYIDMHYNELAMELSRVISDAMKDANQVTIPTNTYNFKDSIIVADDSMIIRTIVNKALSNEFDVLQAEDGNKVIEIIENNKDKNIVGLLLDLNMPKADGFVVLDYFKENGLFDTIPVSLITGDDTKDAADRVFQYPIVDMLGKPFSEDKLRGIVERTISRHKTM